VKRDAKKVLVLFAGIIFILLGLVGLVLPFLQGILFIILGLILVSLYFPRIRSLLQRHAERAPHLLNFVNTAEAWVIKFIGDI
jgi:uncharacterized membrane protein YbaN (DUF454 family)